METCASCGQPLGTVRFCPHCGHPTDDWRTGTAERPAVRDDDAAPPAGPPPPPFPPVPAPPYVAPVTDAPRFPLFADEVAPSVAGTADSAGSAATGSHAGPPRREAPPWLPWVAGGAALLLVAVLGAWLFLGPSDDPTPAAASSAPGAPSTARAGRTPASSPSHPASQRPSTKPHQHRLAKPQDVARLATVRVPATAPPNQDVEGNLVRYEGRNLLDGVPQTCWRMPGDGTGRTITIRLARPTTLTRVGLVNGYAKLATGAHGTKLDWYHGNRRVLAVAWVLDDGTTLRQDLSDTKRLQTVPVDHVRTRTVRLRLLSVSAPGSGRASRDNTAISDVSLVGSPA